MLNSGYKDDAKALRKALELTDANPSKKPEYDVTRILETIQLCAASDGLDNDHLHDVLGSYCETVATKLSRKGTSDEKKDAIAQHRHNLRRGSYWEVMALYLAWLASKHPSEAKKIYKRSGIKFRQFQGPIPTTAIGEVDFKTPAGTTVYTVDASKAVPVVRQALAPLLSFTNWPKQAKWTVLACCAFMSFTLFLSYDTNQKVQNYSERFSVFAERYGISDDIRQDVRDNKVPATVMTPYLERLVADERVERDTILIFLKFYSDLYKEFQADMFEFSDPNEQRNFTETKAAISRGELDSSSSILAKMAARMEELPTKPYAEIFKVYVDLIRISLVDFRPNEVANYAIAAYQLSGIQYEARYSFALQIAESLLDYSIRTKDSQGIAAGLGILSQISDETLAALSPEFHLDKGILYSRLTWELGNLEARREYQSIALTNALELTRKCRPGLDNPQRADCGTSYFLVGTYMLKRGWMPTISDSEKFVYLQQLKWAPTYFDTALNYLDEGTREFIVAEHYRLESQYRYAREAKLPDEIARVRSIMRERISDLDEIRDDQVELKQFLLAEYVANLYTEGNQGDVDPVELTSAIRIMEINNDRDKERAPFTWASYLQQISYVRITLYDITRDVGVLEQSIADYERSFGVLTAENDNGWGGDRINYGNALYKLYNATGNSSYMDSATRAYWESANFSRKKGRLIDTRIALRNLRWQANELAANDTSDCWGKFASVVTAELSAINTFFDRYEGIESLDGELEPLHEAAVKAGEKTIEFGLSCLS